MTQNSEALPKGTQVAHCEILRAVGQGGFGITYHARDIALDKPVALKEFFPRQFARRTGTQVTATGPDAQLYPVFLERFKKEAQAQFAFRHPNVPAMHSLSFENDTAYMKMEYVDGRTLDHWLETSPKLTADDLRRVFEPVIDALSHLHKGNMLHRDVSPKNIMICSDGKSYLIDFSAFKHGWHDDPQASSHIVANPGFGAPEQLVASAADTHGAATDVYGVAATMYKFVSGSPPLDPASRMQVMSQRYPDPLPPLAKMAKADYPKGAMLAIDRALSLRADKRPQSMQEFRAELGWSLMPMADTTPADSGWRRIRSRATGTPTGSRKSMAIDMSIAFSAVLFATLAMPPLLGQNLLSALPSAESCDSIAKTALEADLPVILGMFGGVMLAALVFLTRGPASVSAVKGTLQMLLQGPILPLRQRQWLPALAYVVLLLGVAVVIPLYVGGEVRTAAPVACEEKAEMIAIISIALSCGIVFHLVTAIISRALPK